MVTLSEAVSVLCPAAIPQVDYAIGDAGAGPAVTYWSPALGAQPTAGQIAAVTDAQVTAARLAKARTLAAALVDAADAPSRIDRAILLLLLDELNTLRSWDVSLKAAIAAATNLANLQTRVAALANLPDRTAAQVKAAVAAKIASADAD